jgi:sirohydrochlorin ferrochelatase
MTAGLEIPPPEQTGVIVVDHGSRREASNQMLLEIASLFQQYSGYGIVEPAHMELAEPSIGTAFGRCVERGARLVVIHPYFLLPGRHSKRDIPALTSQAAKPFPDVPYLITEPLGKHRLMVDIMTERVEDCLRCGRSADS